MESFEFKNMEIKPCAYSPGRYDVFESREAESGKIYSKDIAYGVTLERAVTLMVENIGFEEARDLTEFLEKYSFLKDELLNKLSKIK